MVRDREEVSAFHILVELILAQCLRAAQIDRGVASHGILPVEGVTDAVILGPARMVSAMMGRRHCLTLKDEGEQVAEWQFEAPMTRMDAKTIAGTVEHDSIDHHVALFRVEQQFTDTGLQGWFRDWDGKCGRGRNGFLDERAGLVTVCGESDLHGGSRFLFG
ncbi:hypothetical protein N9W17_06115 [Jannaschia sp.]|nr:hypothetical protein [Jannaschia sp.]